MNAPTAPDSPNIPDRYEIIAELGSGGMGAVYKVRDISLDKVFALKVLKFNPGTASDAIVRFQKEARASASLQHENIISIIDFGFHNQITPYMVLEYVEGETLQQRLKKQRRLAPDEAINIFTQIARGLAYAHGKKIVHRDLKSSNIMLTEGPGGHTIVKLFDFGIARMLEESTEMHITVTNAIIGTPKYMSPEQASGQRADDRSDIYSFGCVMFETLTGKMPFKADNTYELLEMQVKTEAPKIGSLVAEFTDSQIETVVDKCLQKNPDNRFQSANSILEILQSSRSTADDHVAHPIPVQNTSTSSRWIFGGIAIIVLCVLLVGTFALISTNKKPEEKLPPSRATLDGMSGLPAMDLSPADENVKKKKKKHKIDWIIENEKKVPTVHLYQIADFEVSDLPSLPAHVREIDITNLKPTDDLFKSIAKLKFLTDIKMHNMDNVSTAQIAQLRALPNLQFITANGTSFQDVTALTRIKSLENLRLPEVSPAQVAALSSLPKLTTLSLDDGVRLNSKMAEALCTLKNLKRLEFKKAYDMEPAVFSRLSTLDHLGFISLCESPSITRADIQSLTKLKLWRLELRRDSLQPEDLKQISKMGTLTFLDIRGNKGLSDESLTYLHTMPELKLMRIDGSRFSEHAKNTLIQQRKKYVTHFDLITKDEETPMF